MKHSTGDDPADNPEPISSILQRHPYLRPTTQQFVILLESMPCPVPAVVRLRAVLKSLRRAYNLRCVSAIDATGEGIPHE